MGNWTSFGQRTVFLGGNHNNDRCTQPKSLSMSIMDPFVYKRTHDEDTAMSNITYNFLGSLFGLLSYDELYYLFAPDLKNRTRRSVFKKL